MNTNEILVLMLGFAMRLGVPLLATLLLIYGLQKLDTRWQKEAEVEHTLLSMKDGVFCWKDRGLSQEEFKTHASECDKPCWQVYRLPNGYLREACLNCEVFINAPAPILEKAKAHA